MKITIAFLNILLLANIFSCSPQETSQNQNQHVAKQSHFSQPKIASPQNKDATQTQQEVMVLSGGSSPFGNNYSQYLQALRLDAFFQSLSKLRHTVFFASGLKPENKDQLPPDVAYKEQVDSDVIFVDGLISNNQAATKDNIQSYFQKTLKNKNWKTDESFLLIVGDHGLPNQYDPFNFRIDENGEVEKTYYENCIDLWHPEIDLYPESGYLSVSELKDLVENNVPKTVPFYFVMTQCYSGGFHALAYHYNEKGYPEKDPANRCGFTAITKDTTSSGCTSFVNKETYDGYERRMTEEITGLSVISGQSLKTSTTFLSKAHDKAFLSDHTKDVPLRTSEAYLLDWFEAYALNHKKWDEKELEKIWDDIALQKDFNHLLTDSLLKKDFERRLDLIQKMFAQLQNWYPMQHHTFKKTSLKEVSALLKSAATLKSKIGKEVDDYNKSFQNELRPLLKKYILSLKDRTDDEAKYYREFEKIFKISSNLYYSRLFKEDPSLKKYQDFANYSKNRDDKAREWAKANLNETKTLDELEDIKTQLLLAENEWVRQDVLYGELRRLKVQMKIAAGLLWLAQNNKQKPFKDFLDFVVCETQAQIQK